MSRPRRVAFSTGVACPAGEILRCRFHLCQSMPQVDIVHLQMSRLLTRFWSFPNELRPGPERFILHPLRLEKMESREVSSQTL